MTSDTEVLIAGAGPTGLVLALWLTRLGVRVRIVDKEAEPGTTSRALVVHARTLELYRQIGIADGVVAQSLKFGAVNLWVRGAKRARVVLGDIGAGVSPYPYMVVFAQDRHERFLIERLRELGVEVERPTEVVDFEEHGRSVSVRLKRSNGSTEACEAAFLAGCDGARSMVRDGMNTGFPGGTYSHIFYVADVDASGPVMNGELNLALDEADFLAVFPMKADGTARLIGTVEEPAKSLEGAHPMEWKDVSRGAIDRLGIVVGRVNWFSTYHVHHRVAAHFRAGRAFLLGDAAHIHSPVGGQGMNTGIGDAVNLAWKLAAVLQGRAGDQLLDTYEPERIAFARRLVATTDRAFQLVISDGPTARFVRLRVVPRLLPILFSFATTRRLMFRTVSQTAIDYRGCALSAGVAGAVRGGDRLPWVALDGRTKRRQLGEHDHDHEHDHEHDNFDPLSSIDWQVHVYGEPSPAIATACRASDISLHAFPWQETMRAAGFVRGTAYLVRPDGYVGLVDSDPEAVALQKYLVYWKLKGREPVGGGSVP